MLVIRQYQQEIITKLRSQIVAGCRSVLISSPTGSGKTVIIAHVMQGAAGKGSRAWFLVHRRELLSQAVRTFEECGLEVGIVSADHWMQPSRKMQVCSVQALARRLDRLPPPDIIVTDEAHHQPASTYAKIREKHPKALLIGITATPVRMDGAGLGEWFSSIVPGPSVSQLIAEGWLAPYRLFAPSRVDLSNVHMVAGDYNKREMSAVMSGSTVVGDAVTEYRKHAWGRQAIVFSWSLEASRETVEEFKAAGVKAEHVDGGTDGYERDAIMRRFAMGQTTVVSNVDLLGEGFDAPDAEVAIMMRPTASLGIYLQQVGRVLRPKQGKIAMILDMAANCHTHGLPDDDRVWKLEMGRPTRRNTLDAVRQCPSCYGISRASAVACRDCGKVFPGKPREVRRLSGELSEFTALVPSLAHKEQNWNAKTYEHLVALGRSRAYRSPETWARHVMQARNTKARMKRA